MKGDRSAAQAAGLTASPVRVGFPVCVMKTERAGGEAAINLQPLGPNTSEGFWVRRSEAAGGSGRALLHLFTVNITTVTELQNKLEPNSSFSPTLLIFNANPASGRQGAKATAFGEKCASFRPPPAFSLPKAHFRPPQPPPAVASLP